jgi:hypothetical protein
MLSLMSARVWLVLALVGHASSGFAADRRCASVAQCVRELIAASLRASPGEINQQERDLSKQLTTFGAPAVQELIPLLDDERTASAAAYALSRFGPVAKPAMPALKRALLLGNGWAPDALSAIGDDAAIAALVEGVMAGWPAAGFCLVRMGPSGQRALGKALVETRTRVTESILDSTFGVADTDGSP